MRAREGVHAAPGEVDAGDGVHVGDDRVDRQRVLRREAGVHRLEAEQALGPRVVEVLPHLRREPAETADRHELGEVLGEQVDRRVDVGVDEVAHLVAVERRDEVDVAAVARSLGGGDHALDLVGHRVDVGVHVELGAVGVEGAVERLDGDEVEPVVHVLADGGERVADQVGHREDGRSGVEAEAGVLDEAGSPAGDALALEDGDLRPAPASRRAHERPASPAPTITTWSVRPVTVRSERLRSDMRSA